MYRQHRLLILVLCLGVGLAASGCKVLRLNQGMAAQETDWLTEGDSPQRRHATDEVVAPPLEEVWDYNASAGFGPGSPLIVGNAVLVATRKGEVHAVEFESGKRLGFEGFGESIEGTPVVQNGVLFVPVGWGNRALMAYDLRQGKRLWRLSGEPIEAGLLAVEGGIIAVDVEARVARYDARSGKEVWAQSLGDEIHVQAAPVAAGSHIVIADDRGGLTALDAATGAVSWTYALGAPVYATPAVQGDLLLLPTTRGQFVALDTSTQQERWRIDLPDATVRFTSPAVEGELVVVGASDGYLRGFDLSGGEQQWSYFADDALTGAPLLTSAFAYIGTMGGHLLAVHRSNGEPAWKTKLRGRVKSAMAARGDYLVVLSEPRFVYLFKSSAVTGNVASP